LSLIAVVAFGLAVPRPAAAESYTLTTLASFNGTNGFDPRGDLVRDAQGNPFGATGHGGAFGLGTVFELAAGSGTNTLERCPSDVSRSFSGPITKMPR
jgi:uncharacterized repeat protein (TIGR03803 family)